jgi:hypothetical protein
MKVRDGFVSNSSSSSFVLVGIKLTAAERKTIDKLAEEKDVSPDELPTLKGLDVAGYDSTDYVGQKWTLDSEEPKNLSIDVLSVIERVQQKIEERFVGRGKDVKLHIGWE